MATKPIGIGQPFRLRVLLADTLRRMGFVEVHRGRNIAIAVTLGLFIVPAFIWLHLAAGIVLTVLAFSAPSFLRDLRFRGTDGFRFRIVLEPRDGTTDLLLLPDDSERPIATAELPDEDWRIPVGFLRRATPVFLPIVAGLLARGFREGRETPLLALLGDDLRREVRVLSLLGHVGRLLRERGHPIRSSVPTLPFPMGIQVLILSFLSGGISALCSGDTGFAAGMLGLWVSILLTGMLNLRSAPLGVQFGRRKWGVTAGPHGIALERSTVRHRTLLRPSEVLDDELALREPAKVEAAVDRLIAEVTAD